MMIITLHMIYCQRVPTGSDQASIEHTDQLNHYWCLEPNRKNSAVLFVVTIDWWTGIDRCSSHHVTKGPDRPCSHCASTQPLEQVRNTTYSLPT